MSLLTPNKPSELISFKLSGFYIIFCFFLSYYNCFFIEKMGKGREKKWGWWNCLSSSKIANNSFIFFDSETPDTHPEELEQDTETR